MSNLNIEEYLDNLSNNITSLELPNNIIFSIPICLPDLSKFINLKMLFINNLNSGYITNLPINLVWLSCRNNNLTSLPKLPNTLKHLDCGNNKLQKLPELPNLDFLNCNNNLLTQLPILPNTLKMLYCGSNQIYQLPNLPTNLDMLICYNNNLSSIPILPKSLKQLVCSENNLPFENIYKWNIFNKFKKTFYTLKFGPKLEKYYIKKIRNKTINMDFLHIVYSPDYNFYKRFLEYLKI
jgi:Leucine-rich repeat (LRR) protein